MSLLNGWGMRQNNSRHPHCDFWKQKARVAGPHALKQFSKKRLELAAFFLDVLGSTGMERNG